MTSCQHRLVVEAEEAGERLDRYVTTRFPELSRTRVQALIEAGEVRVGVRPGRASTKVAAGDHIVLAIPAPVAVALEPESIPLHVVYEDRDLLVVNKPAGLVVHPAPGHPQGTLVNALLAHCSDLAGIGGDLRPGIVHRLDKDTSGLIVVAKHDQAHRLLATQFRERSTDKCYWALLDGAPASESGTIDAPIGRHPQRTQPMAIVPSGRAAKTHFRILQRFLRHTFVE
ncbi:MAG: RluA family pseudouridine synthase, partial [Chloroflexota bacterium]|nr:RluA family pseudouridine synthase [Chloroflexota bacterium]